MGDYQHQWLVKTAEFYGITVEEAKDRYRKVTEQRDNPSDPICVGCAKRPEELACYTSLGPFGEGQDYESVTDYVLQEEGTLNETNGHFLCDDCYIKNGQPSSPRGWKAP